MKKIVEILHVLFDIYIFGNIHVGLTAFALTKITLYEVGISDNTAPLFVFFATIFSYNIIRFLRVEHIKSWFYNWNIKNRFYLYGITIISGLFLVYFLFQIRFKAILVIFPFMLFTFFYAFPVKRFSLREKPGIKLVLIAVSWAGITVFFPLVQNYMQIRPIDWITFLQRFLFVFAITIPFDIRDLKYDSDLMKTIPQRFGVIRAKQIAIILLLFFLVLGVFKGTSSLLIYFIITCTSIIFILFSEVRRNKYYTSFFIEGIPLLWLFLQIVL